MEGHGICFLLFNAHLANTVVASGLIFFLAKIVCSHVLLDFSLAEIG